ncbi:MAG TPA: hypothetical protein VJP58_01245, partial [Candidatus Nitrosocosmicus sp.]|nr:hypothetical protein [Candidatus Nitrosocosmicus sp.]
MFKEIRIDKHKFNLFLLVISTFLLSQSYGIAISFAQTESVLVCDFVQYCSNPVELNSARNDTSLITQTTPETNTQTTPETNTQTTSDSSELLPDVTSNISLIMTPDLPGNFANETQPASSNATESTQPVIPENATVITPDAQIPPANAGENISMTIEDGNDTITADINSSNQSQFADTVPLENATITIDDNNMSQISAANETVGTTGANETVGTTGANETVGTTGANETVGTTGANETVGTTGANETVG